MKKDITRENSSFFQVAIWHESMRTGGSLRKPYKPGLVGINRAADGNNRKEKDRATACWILTVQHPLSIIRITTRQSSTVSCWFFLLVDHSLCVFPSYKNNGKENNFSPSLSTRFSISTHPRLHFYPLVTISSNSLQFFPSGESFTTSIFYISAEGTN